MLRKIFPALVMPLLAAGCMAPDLGPLPKLAGAERHRSETVFGADRGASWPEQRWWELYRDPQLTALIEEALSASPDIAVAAARIRAAQGSVERAGAPRLPQLGAEASAGFNKQSYNNGIPAEFVPKGFNDVGRVALDADLDLDLWGRNRAALAAATSEAEAIRIDAAQAALLLTTDIAATYADLARLYAERDVLQRALEVRSATARLVSERFASGLETQGELRQSSSAIPAARVDLAANAEQIALAKNRLAALAGAGPDRALAIVRPAAAITVADGLPPRLGIDLVGRRPDIAAARSRAEAAADRINVARADFYPDISISGLIGLQSLGLGNLLKGSSSIADVGPAISLPIFRGGELRGRFREARGQYDEAVATYDRTVLAALREVADAVVSRDQTAAQWADARAALGDAEAAFRIAQLRYRGGLSTFLNVLSAEQTVLTARRTLADIEARRFMLDVALVRALGGGFRAPAPERTSDS